MPRYHRIADGSSLPAGLQGSVALYRDTTTGKTVVVKRANRGGERELLLEEFVYTRLGAHRHIVEYVEGLHECQRGSALVLGYCERGDLFEMLELQEKRTGRVGLSESLVASIVWDVRSALHHCQRRGVSHLDVKPENIFCTSEKFVLGDFGLSAIHKPNKSEIYVGYKGTPMYMSPEVSACAKVRAAKVKIVGELADVWGLGISCFAMLAGTGPFLCASDDDRFFQALRGRDINGFWNAHEAYQGRVFASANAKDFINKCLVVDPAHRATLVELAEHPWMAFRLSPEELANHPLMGGIEINIPAATVEAQVCTTTTTASPRSVLSFSATRTVVAGSSPRKRKLNLDRCDIEFDLGRKSKRLNSADHTQSL